MVVSIILPTFNRAFLLNDCFKSVINQTYTDWELIIMDDSSHDNTPEVSADIIKIDSRIRYYRNEENLGLPKNRNVGIIKSKGDFILFIEDDIILEPSCLQVLMSTFLELKNNGVDVGAIGPGLILEHSETSDDSRRNILNYFKEKIASNSVCAIDSWTGIIFCDFSPNFPLTEAIEIPACSLYSKDVLNRVRGYAEDVFKGNYMYEGTDLNFRIRKMGYKLFFQPIAQMHHKTIGQGGCKLPFCKWSYYFVYNHLIFLIRNFGFKSFYMIPCFFAFSAFTLLKYKLESH